MCCSLCPKSADKGTTLKCMPSYDYCGHGKESCDLRRWQYQGPPYVENQYSKQIKVVSKIAMIVATGIYTVTFAELSNHA